MSVNLATVTISADITPFQDAMERLFRLLESPADLPYLVVRRLRAMSDHLNEFVKLRIDPVEGGNMLFTAKPSAQLQDILYICREL
jgi:hypothetical protein